MALSILMVFGCSGGGGSGGDSTGSAPVSMSITDAKPLLPDNVKSLLVEIDEVLVHKSGGGWISLPLPESPSPFIIDLLQFYDGNITELVPPTKLEYGKYTQVRLIVSRAELIFDYETYTEERTVEIPPDHLKTNKNFTFDVDSPTAVDIVVDFDCSMSLIEDKSTTPPSYKLKPVLHLVEYFKAATIIGNIDNDSFSGDLDAIVTVYVYSDDGSEREVYTKLQVTKSDTEGTTETEFSVFWLLHDKEYYVEIDFDPASESVDYFEDNIGLEEDQIHFLKGEEPI
jgi:hypothetical protein